MILAGMGTHREWELNSTDVDKHNGFIRTLAHYFTPKLLCKFLCMGLQFLLFVVLLCPSPFPARIANIQHQIYDLKVQLGKMITQTLAERKGKRENRRKHWLGRK